MNGIAVFFPGIGYHCDKPLLYFSRELAKETGYQELVNVSYAYHGGDIRGNPEKCGRRDWRCLRRRRTR